MGKPLVFEILGDASNVTKVFDKFQEHAGKVALAAAAAFAGAKIGDAIAAGLETEAVNAKLAAQLGGTGPVAEKAGAAAAAVFRDGFGAGVGDVAGVIQQVGTAMGGLEGVSQETLEGITGRAMTVADTFDQDVNGVVRAAGQLVKNDLAPDMNSALDTIAAGFTNGLNASDDFLDTLTEYADPLNQLGLSADDALGLFKSGLDAGAFSLDKVGDSINEFATRAIDGSKSTTDAYAALGLNADDTAAKIAAGGPAAQEAFSQVLQALSSVQDPVAQDAAGVALFGSMWEDAGKSMVLSLDPAKAAVVDTTDAAAEMGATMYDTNESKVGVWRRGIEGATQDLIDVKGPIGLAAAATQEFGGDLFGMLAVLGPTVVAVQNMGLAGKAAAAGAKISTAAQWLWNAALSANPIAIVVLAIAALVAGFVWAYQNVDWFREGVQTAFAWVQNAISNVVTWVTANWPLLLAILTGPIGLAVLAITKNWDTIKGGAQAAVTWITDKWNGLIGWFESAPSRFAKAAGGMFGGLWSSFRGEYNKIVGAWNDFKLEIGGGSVLGVSIPRVTLNTPNIPMLADGGIATRATLAMIGEGRGPEAVVPLDRLPEFLDKVNGRPSSGAGNRLPQFGELHVHGVSAADVMDEIEWRARR